jgi:DNA-damage-inducible protein J
MPAEAIIEMHVDETVRQQAQQIYSAAGVTIEDMFRRMLLKTVEDKAIPMDFFRPNAETIAAMEAARRGEFEGKGSIQDLFADLDADD